MKVRVIKKGNAELPWKRSSSKCSRGKELQPILIEPALPPGKRETRIGDVLLEQLQIHQELNSSSPDRRSMNTRASETNGSLSPNPLERISAGDVSNPQAVGPSPPPRRPNTVCAGAMPSTSPWASSNMQIGGDRNESSMEHDIAKVPYSGLHDDLQARLRGHQASIVSNGKGSILPQIWSGTSQSGANQSDMLSLPQMPLNEENWLLLARAKKYSKEQFKDRVVAMGSARRAAVAGMIDQAGGVLQDITHISEACQKTMDTVKHLLPEQVEDEEDILLESERRLSQIGHMNRAVDSSEDGDDSDDNEEEEETMEDGWATQLLVTGPDYQLATGIFTLVPDCILHGKPVWQKFGTAFCLRWLDGNAPPEESIERQSSTPLSSHRGTPLFDRQVSTPDSVPRPDSSAATDSAADSASEAICKVESPDVWSGWSGWILCTHDSDNIKFMRGVTPTYEDVLPWKLDAWEVVDAETDSWNIKPTAKVETLPKPPASIHIFDSLGKLGGTCEFSDDRDGRSSYKRDDAPITVSYSSDWRRWVIEVNSKSGVQQVARSSDDKDVLNPTLLSAWQRWDAKAGSWYSDSGLILKTGAHPPDQIYVSKCVHQSATGVYDLMRALSDDKPSYQKVVHDVTHVISWQSHCDLWLLDKFKCGRHCHHIARSRNPKYLPTKIKAKEWEQLVASDEPNSKEWTNKTRYVMSVVETAPKDIFLDIQPLSSMIAARGVYARCNHVEGGRSCYQKHVDRWKIFFDNHAGAWKIEFERPARQDASKNVTARLFEADVPDPTLIPADKAYWWQVCDSSGSEWHTDVHIRISSAVVPPRRLYVHGQRLEHPLYGIYFLRGLKSGRACYAKESVTVPSKAGGRPGVLSGQERGQIYWTGETTQMWEIRARGNPDEPTAQAFMKDDIPWPSAPTVKSWETEEYKEKRLSVLNLRKLSRRPSKKLTGSSDRFAMSPKRESMPENDIVGRIAFDLPQGPLLGSLHTGSPTARSDHSEKDDSDTASSCSPEPTSRPVSAGDLNLLVEASEEKDAPKALFVSGQGNTHDAVFFIKDEMIEGRTAYENQYGDKRLIWDHSSQIWAVQEKGTKVDPWVNVLGRHADVPDPSVGKSTWMMVSTGDTDSESSDSHDSEGSNQSLHDATKRETFTIVEEEDEDEDEDEDRPGKGRRNSKKQDKTDGEAIKSVASDADSGERWKPAPHLKCVTVNLPPLKIFVVGTATSTDFTGVFTLLPESVNQPRPMYRAENVGWATPCVIRYVVNMKRWVIERVPKLKGFGKRWQQTESSTMFMLAGVEYDAPNPTLVNATWDVKKGDSWQPEPGIYCREVRAPPTQICFFGDGKMYNDVAGTYTIEPFSRRDRPMYVSAENNMVVKYHKESTRWMIMRSDGPPDVCLYMVKCNVPGPVETLSVCWKSMEPTTGKKEVWKDHPTFACFEGAMPAKQIFCKGGHRGLSGVYSILFRHLYNQRFTYRKLGTSWHMWWSAKQEAWVIGNIHYRGGMGNFKEKGDLETIGEAWCHDDISHPHKCKQWHFKGRHYTPGGNENTSRGVLMDAEIAEAIGESPLKCEQVGDPPEKLLVKRLEEGKVMAGIYFLHDDLHQGRCAYLKQCNLRKSESWAMFYVSSSAKWNIDRNGLQTIGKPQAQVSCDCPDPTMVPSSWMVRNSEGTWVASTSLTVLGVKDPPQQVFVTGAFKTEAIDFDMKISAMEFNGVYSLFMDHNKRPCYKKDLDQKWVIRFQAQSSRWIIDDRAEGPEIKDDASGSCSACCDCFHPACVDGLWQTWHIPEDNKQKRTRSKEKKIRRRSVDAGTSDQATATRETQSRALNSAMLASFSNEKVQRGRGSSVADVNSSSGGPSNSDVASNSALSISKSQISSLGNFSTLFGPGAIKPGKHKLKISSMSKMSVGSRARSVVSVGSHMSGASQALSYMSAISAVTNGSSTSGSGGANNGAKQTYESWVDNRVINVVAITPAPEKVYLSSVTPKELEGIYHMIGHHEGRPVYRMVNQDGSFKTAVDEDQTELAAARKVKRQFTAEFVSQAERDIEGAAQRLSMLAELHSGSSSPKGSAGCSPSHSRNSSKSQRRVSVSKEHRVSHMESPNPPGEGAPQSARRQSVAGIRRSGVRFRESVCAVNDGGDAEEMAARSFVLEQRLKNALIPKESGTFDFSHHGYCIRWHPKSKSWILGEFQTTKVVHYDYRSPEQDVVLEGGKGFGLFVVSVAPSGMAHRAGIPLYCELVSVNGDEEFFKNYEPHRALKDVEMPAVLKFKLDGIPSDEHGHMMMEYDAPYPSAYCISWMVPFDGGISLPSEEKVQCRCIECPPSSLKVSGHRGKPKDVSGSYELQPTLHAGRAKYAQGRWEISWNPRKTRWTISDSSSGKAFAYAHCCAPHPAAVGAHGGYWEILADPRCRTLEVVAQQKELGRQGLIRIFENSLAEILHLADNPNALTGPKKDGRKRYDKTKVKTTLVDLKNILTEVYAFDFQSDRFDDGVKARKKLAGFLMLEDLLATGERKNATVAFWMEALTELKATLRTDRADTTVAYDDGWTALHVIAAYGYNEAWTYEAASVLKAYGAVLDKHDEQGVSPVLRCIYAEKYENARAFLRILSGSAETLDITSNAIVEQNQALLKAAVEGNHLEVRMAGTAARVDLNITDDEGRSAIHLLTERNQASGVEILLKENADPNLQDSHGDTPLHVAARHNCQVTLCILLRSGCSPVVYNKDGKTAYMVAITEDAKDCIREMVKGMVHWSEIEAVLGKERHNDAEDWRGLVRNKVQDLLKLGFDDAFADPLAPGKNIDRLQLVNHLVIQNIVASVPGQKETANGDAAGDPEPAQDAWRPKICFLQMRGFLIANELMVPLLKLLGDGGLDVNDHVKYLSFVRYLLNSGFAAFCGVEASAYVQSSRETLHDLFRSTYERFEAVANMTEENFGFVGRAAGTDMTPPWRGIHQYFAHGDLWWLSADGACKDLLGALAALVNIDAFDSVHDMCGTVLQTTEFIRGVPIEKAPPRVLQEFWTNMYPRWLVGCAKQAMTSLSSRCGQFGTRLQMAPVKSLSALLEGKASYRKLTKSVFGHSDDEPEELVPHILEAGGATDLVECSILASSIESLEEVFEEFKAMDFEEHGLELVYTENEFRRDDDTQNIKVLKLGVLVSVTNGHTILATVNLTLRRYDMLQRHLQIVEEFQEGKYLQANNWMRSNCTLNSGTPMKRRFAFKMSTLTVPHGTTTLWWWATAKEMEEAGLRQLPEGAIVLKDPTSRETPAHMRRRSVTRDSSISAHTNVFQWVRNHISQCREEQEALMVNSVWIELKPNGSELPGRHASLDRTVPENSSVMGKDDLIRILEYHFPDRKWKERTAEQKEVERLAYDLRTQKVRLFKDPAGDLTAVQDFVIVYITGPDYEQTLVRESAPYGIPVGPRKTTLTLEMAAGMLIRTDLPQFLQQDVFEVQKVDPTTDGAFIVRVPEDTAGLIPRAKRFFNIQATVKREADAFALCQAALTVGDRCPGR